MYSSVLIEHRLPTNKIVSTLRHLIKSIKYHLNDNYWKKGHMTHGFI